MLSIILYFICLLSYKTPGGQLGPPKFVLPQILFLLWLKTPCQILEPYDNPFWEKSNIGRENKKKKKKKRC